MEEQKTQIVQGQNIKNIGNYLEAVCHELQATQRTIKRGDNELPQMTSK